MTKTLRVYIAGPMTGYRGFNFAAFDRARDAIEDMGHIVTSPADLDRDCGFHPDPYCPGGADTLPEGFMAEAMRRDVEALLHVDMVVLLPGWSRSTGARFELAIARKLGLGVCIYEHDDDGEPVLVHLSEEDEEAAVAAAEREGYRCHYEWGPPLTIDFDGPEEVRVTSATGGQKGSKPARFDMIPPEVLWELAEHYGRGEAKYPSDPVTFEANWQKGYAWSLSAAALMRHLFAWLDGEDTDPETGSSHLIAVIWHAMALRWFQLNDRGTDDLQGRRPS